MIAPGQLADLAVLSADYFTVPEEAIKRNCARHPHTQAWLPKESLFWGIGCDCFAF